MKKRLLSALLAFALVFSMFPIVTVYATTEGDYTYTVENGEATITGYAGAGGDLTIPSILGGYPVTVINDNAFLHNKTIRDVTVPDCVKTIGSAFVNSSLEFLRIGKGVTSIDNFVAYNCSVFFGFSVSPDNATYSSEYGILYNKDKSVLIKAGTYAPDTLTIPDSVTTVCEYAFFYCFGLKTLTIGDGVTTIGEAAFASCYELTTVTIPSGVTSIGALAFDSCASLTDVHYGGTEAQWNKIAIGNNNEDLLNATIHFAEETEAPDAADYSYTVENDEATITGYTGAGGDITIPSMLGGYPVTTIGADAFSLCRSLTSVTIPASVTTIGAYVFSYCSSLTSVTIPASVTTIGHAAFYSCNDLTSVTIPDSVTTIDNYAFASCYALTTVTIPASVTTIGENAFRQCYRLTGIWVDADNVNYSSDDCGVLFNKDKTTLIMAPGGISGAYTIPDGVTVVETDAFYYCKSLKSVSIPESVTTIAVGAFSDCSKQAGIWVDADNANYSSDDSGVLFNKDKTTLVQAPGGISGTYTIPQSVITVGEEAFSWCDSLTAVIIADSVLSIGDSAFSYCTGLTSVTIPDSVITIEELAFYWCSNLTSVTIGNSVSTIGGVAFGLCSKLTIYGPDGSYAQQYANASSIPFVILKACNGEAMFATLQDALDAYETGFIQLLADAESVTVTKNAVVDLNGFNVASVTATNGALTVLDSKTDDYSVADNDYGKIAAISGTVKPADNYIAIAEADGTSYHKVSLEITDMVLRSEEAGIYYNCIFNGDEMVADQVTGYGVALSVRGIPVIGESGTGHSVFTNFTSGTNTPSTLLKNVLKGTNTAAQNNCNADMQIYGRAYIQIGDSYIYGETVSRSFREQVELADTMWSSLSAEQQTAVLTMYRTFQEAMDIWTIPNIKSSV